MMQSRLCNTVWNALLTAASVLIMALSLVLVSYLISVDTASTGRPVFVTVLGEQAAKCHGQNDSRCFADHAENVFKSYLSGSMVLLGFDALEVSPQRLELLKGYIFVVYMCYVSTQICNVFLAVQCLRFLDFVQTATRKKLGPDMSLSYPRDLNIYSNTSYFLSDSGWKIACFGLCSALVFVGGFVFFKLALGLDIGEAFILLVHIGLKCPVKLDSFVLIFLAKLPAFHFPIFIFLLGFLFFSYLCALIRASVLVVLISFYSSFLKGFSHTPNLKEIFRTRPAKPGYLSEFRDMPTPLSTTMNFEPFHNPYGYQHSNQNTEFEEESTAF